MPFQRPDTRIALGALGGQQEQGGGALGTLGAMMQIKEQQMAHQARQREAELQRRQMEDDDETRFALQNAERPDDAVEQLWKAGRSTAASKLAQSVYLERKAKSDEYVAKIDSHTKAFGHAAQILQGVNDNATLATARKAIMPLIEPILGQGAQDMIPTEYDEKKIKAIIASGTSRAQQLQEERNTVLEAQNAWNLGMQADPKTGMWSPHGLQAREAYHNLLARKLSVTTNKQEWDDTLRLAHANGTPKEVATAFGVWEEGAPEKARRLGMTIPQEENAKTAATRAENAGADGGVSATGARVSKGKRDDDNAETEEWVREAFVKDNPRPKGTKISEWKPPPFDLKKLSDANKAEFVRRKIQAEDNNRSRQNMPPLLDAAKAAAARGDVAGYEKVRGIFNSLTQDLVKLEDLAPPPDEKAAPPASRGASSFPMPGAAARQPFSMGPSGRGPAGGSSQARAQAIALADQLDKERDPKKRAALEQQLRALIGQ